MALARLTRSSVSVNAIARSPARKSLPARSACRSDVGEHGGRHEVAVGQRAVGQRPPPASDTGALLEADVEIAGDPLQLFGGHQRTDLSLRIGAVADDQALAVVGDPADEFVVDLLLDEQAAAGGAHLSGVVEDRHRGGGDGDVEVGVGEDDVRRLPAQLERDPLEVAGGGPHDRLTGGGGTGEGDLVDVAVFSQRRARGLAEPRHDIDYAGRNPGFHHQFGEPQRRQRRLFGRLQDHGAAGGERRADLPDARGERAVPGNDGSDHADRFFQRVGEDLAGQRVLDGGAVQRGRLPGIEPQHAEHPQPCGAGAADRGAHVQRIEHAEFVEMGFDQVGKFQQQRLPLIRLKSAARALRTPAVPPPPRD